MLAATLVFGLLLALWTAALPLGDAPDEPAHADLVFHLATGAAYPRHDGRKIGAAVTQLCHDMTAAVRACPRRREVNTPTSIRRHTQANAPPKASRPDFDADGGDTEVGEFNQMLQHPPLFYWAMSDVIRVERAVLPGAGLPPLDRELALLRLVNALLIAPLPLLAWAACRRLGLNDSIGIVAALIPFAIPQFLHVGSTLNNDNLLTLLVAVLTVLLAGVLRGDTSRRTAVAAGAVTGLAMLTKAFALALPVVVVAAYGRAWWHARPRRELVARLSVAGGVSAAIGGWWYLRNMLRGDGFSPSTDEARLNSSLAPRGFHPDEGAWLRRFGSVFTQRFWGWFGWFTVRISIAVIIGATVVLVGSMLVGLASARRVSGTAPAVGRWDLGVMLLPTALFVVLVMARSWHLYSRTSLFSFIQGRYAFPTLVGVAIVAAVGLERLAGRRAALVTLAWVVVMEVEGLRRVLSGYWGDPGSGPVDQVRALVAWSTWPAAWLVGATTAFVAATGWLAFEVAQTTRRPAAERMRKPHPPDEGDESGEAQTTRLPEPALLATQVSS